MKISVSELSEIMGISRKNLTRIVRNYAKGNNLMENIEIKKQCVGVGGPKKEYMFTLEQAYFIISRSRKSKNISNKEYLASMASKQKGGFLNE